MHCTRGLSVHSLKSFGDKVITEQLFMVRDFLDAELVFLKVLKFEIGTLNIAYTRLEDLLIQFKEVAKVGEQLNFEACMDMMDLLYEKEDTSLLYQSSKSLAASILVSSYIITVPKQQYEFPILPWGMQLHGLVLRSGFDTDVSVCNGLIDFYGKCKQIRSSEIIFTEMGTKNAVSWCSLVAAYVQNHEDEKASVLYLRSRKDIVETSDFMISSVLSACAGMAGLELGRSIHAHAVKACVERTIFVGSALVDMYGKCGCIEDSEQAFDEMPEKNLVTRNSLIGGYAHQGQVDMALALFEEMAPRGCGPTPNYMTFVSLLSACSRAGAVENGMKIFDSMRSTYGIEPGAEHYSCIVDMLGRAGMVERAYEFIKKMPIQPTISVWGALQNACRMHGKPQLGLLAAENLFKLDPKDSGNHVLLSNTFAAAGRWAEANTVREELKGVGIKKGAGYSWITVKNQVHAFQAKDRSHILNKEIQTTLAKLRNEMEAAGYKPDLKLSLYDLEEEEKAAEVSHHSEKLALAFGLLSLPLSVPIRITKNLRICGDCHSFFKFVSGSVKREIIVRDNNRFHRFKDGICSCKDYW